MKKAILFFSLFIFCLMANTAQAQDFKSAVGARLGYPLSVTYKHFLNETGAIEVYAGTRGFGGLLGVGGYRWYSVSGGYQIHADIESVEGLQWYYGAGASVFFWTYDFDTDASSVSLGLQAYGGLSYTFEDQPVNISIDWVPTIFLNSYANSGFNAGYGSVAVRYILQGGND